MTYAARPGTPHLRFGNIPRTPPARRPARRRRHPGSARLRRIGVAAIDYALFLCAPEFQGGDYVAHGGQPGSLAAWTGDAANAATRNFFRDTLATLQGAYLRPTRAGAVPFFHAATHRVAAAIAGDMTPSDLTTWLDANYRAMASS